MKIALSDAPKYKQIMRILVAELQERGIEPHSRFFSESELKNRFRVSIATIRMALKELTQEGLIYREHGRGTFVSPPTARQQVLIVGKFEESHSTNEFGIIGFTQSLIEDSAKSKEPCTLIALSPATFAELAPDLKHYYPNANGVLYFRNYRVVKSTYRFLEESGLPYLFYGSDSISDEVKGHPACFYPEAKIIDIGMNHLRAHYGDDIAFAYHPGAQVAENRLRLYREWMEQSGIRPQVLTLSNKKNLYDPLLHEEAYRYLENKGREFRAVFCFDDRFALLFHNAALRLGLRIPEDIAILGINDYPFCSMVCPSISAISIPLFEDGRRCLKALLNQADTGRPQKLNKSRVKLIARQSA